MGDLDSPRPCGRLATIVYEKGNKMSQAAVSLFNRIGMAMLPPTDRVRTSPVNKPRLAIRAGWMLFSILPFWCMLQAFFKFIGDPKLVHPALLVTVVSCGYITHLVMIGYVSYWYRDMPFQLIGANIKFMVEVIPMIIVAALHHLLPFNYAYIALLISIGCTGYFYTFAYLLHVAYDIGAIDVLLGLVMQVLGYMLKVELLVKALALSLFVGFSFYRYLTYCAPDLPVHHKKESDLLPY